VSGLLACDGLPLSDSVFLTHSDPDRAVCQAATLVFNLVNLTLNEVEPLLVRGAMAQGEVRHFKDFLQNQEAANGTAARRICSEASARIRVSGQSG
jgi:hypothetical protein